MISAQHVSTLYINTMKAAMIVAKEAKIVSEMDPKSMAKINHQSSTLTGTLKSIVFPPPAVMVLIRNTSSRQYRPAVMTMTM
jgi:hypothetical protein